MAQPTYPLADIAAAHEAVERGTIGNVIVTHVRARMGTASHRFGWYLAVLQLFFTLCWTVYAIYLPKLAASAGIRAQAPSS